MSKSAMVPVLFGALTIAAALTEARSRSTLSEHIELDGATETHEYDLNVPQEAEMARLVVRARVRSGRIAWKLLDTEGEPRMEGHGVRGNVELDTGRLESPTPGIWHLQVQLQRARGHYRVDWRSE